MTRKEYMHQWYLSHKADQNKRSLVWAKEHRDSRNKSQRKYLLQHPSFTNWVNMMERCYRKSNTRFACYGGKGIQVYMPWHTFQIYEEEWGKTKPGIGYTVDRLDNQKDYVPGNVKWATKSEQTKNQIHNNKYTKGASHGTNAY